MVKLFAMWRLTRKCSKNSKSLYLKKKIIIYVAKIYSATNLPKLPLGFRKVKKLQFKLERGMFAYRVLNIQRGKFI